MHGEKATLQLRADKDYRPRQARTPGSDLWPVVSIDYICVQRQWKETGIVREEEEMANHGLTSQNMWKL